MQNFGPRCKYSGIPHTLLFCKVFVFNILRVQPRFIRIALYLAALLRMHDIARCSVACESRSPIKLYDLPIQKLPLMDTGPSDADSRTEATESKYLMHFQRSLVEVFQSRDDYRNLFSEEEQQIAIPFLNLDIQKQLSRAARYSISALQRYIQILDKISTQRPLYQAISTERAMVSGRKHNFV